MSMFFAFQTTRSLLVLTALVVSSGAWAQASAQPPGQVQCQQFTTESGTGKAKAHKKHEETDKALESLYPRGVPDQVYRKAHGDTDQGIERELKDTLQTSASSFCFNPIAQRLKSAEIAAKAAEKKASDGVAEFSKATDTNINGAEGTRLTEFAGAVKNAKKTADEGLPFVQNCRDDVKAAQAELQKFDQTPAIPKWDMAQKKLSGQVPQPVGRKDPLLEQLALSNVELVRQAAAKCDESQRSIDNAKRQMEGGQNRIESGFGGKGAGGNLGNSNPNAASGHLNPSPSPAANNEDARRAEERAEQAERENARMQQALRDEEMRRQQAQQQAAKAQEEAKKKDDGGGDDKEDNKAQQPQQPNPAPAAPQPSPSPAAKPSTGNYPEICPDGSRNPLYPNGNGCKEKKVTDPLQSAALGAQAPSASKGISNLTAKDCVGVNTASCQTINANAAAGRALVNEGAPSKTRQLVGEEIKKNPLLKNGKK